MNTGEILAVVAAESFRQAPLLVQRSTVAGAGLGVFAGEDFPAGALLEVCRVVTLRGGDESDYEAHTFMDYRVEWLDPSRPQVVAGIPLGVTSLVNHSTTPNVVRVSIYDMDLSVLFCKKPISSGQELFMDYGYSPTA